MLTKIKHIDAACQPPTHPSSRREYFDSGGERSNHAAKVGSGVMGGAGKEKGHPVDYQGVLLKKRRSIAGLDILIAGKHGL
jgi:hypothetical protein